MDISGKRIAVLGAGTSGLAAAKLAKSRGAIVRAYDSGVSEKLSGRVELFAGEGIELITGDQALNPRSESELCVISPGIDAASDIGNVFVSGGAELIGEIEFAWRLGNAKVIGITGTNGKTTTTDLLAKILNDCGVKTVPCGNYGLALSEVVLSGNSYDWYTVELSSFQLETISQFRADVAVWMNFAPDHMDRYTSLEDYRDAKLRIFENQTPDDWSVVRQGENIGHVDSKVVTFSATDSTSDYRLVESSIVSKSGKVIIDFSRTRLNGRHNAENVMAAVAAAECAGIDPSDMVDTILNYIPPAHRCEVIDTVEGVVYVNDSKATNLHAISSSLAGQMQPVVLIAGGKEKGLDFSELSALVEERVNEVVCIGEIAPKIVDVWGDRVPCTQAATLEEAVKISSEKAKPGDVVLFSPGTSSFDMFSGYEERGDVFRAAVQSLN